MKDNISPEEKLLRLIKGQKKPAPVTASPKQTQAAQPKAVLAANRHTRVKKYFAYLSPQRVVLFIFIASFLFLAGSFLYPLWEAKRLEAELKDQQSRNFAQANIHPKEKSKPLEFYLDGAKNRKIFNSLAESENASPAKTADANLIKDINLVGIISGENPQVIIEDKKAQKTYYLSKGQFIGDLEVSDIQDGKIILNYNGQRYELHL